LNLSTLQLIILVTAGAGLISILTAASLSLTLLAKIVNNMVSLSVGILLATAFLHSLPEPLS
jgi:zinc and cadmium transporter